MKGVKELKARLGSVGNIRKVTSTMELVAAAKMKKLQERALASRPYAEAIRDMMAQVARFAPSGGSPLLRQPERVERECLIVIAGDKGLCGAFNGNVFRKAVEHMRRSSEDGVQTTIYAFGKRTEKFFTRVRANVSGAIDEKMEAVDYRRVAATMRALADDFVADRFQRLSIVYTRMRSAVSFEAVVQPLLPFASPEDAGSRAEDDQLELDFLLEPSPEAIMTRLVPKTLEMNLLSAVYESLAAEFASRRIAMKNATDSATEMIDDLRMEYNKARQAGITAELLEVTSGAEALQGT